MWLDQVSASTEVEYDGNLINVSEEKHTDIYQKPHTDTFNSGEHADRTRPNL